MKTKKTFRTMGGLKQYMANTHNNIYTIITDGENEVHLNNSTGKKTLTVDRAINLTSQFGITHANLVFCSSLVNNENLINNLMDLTELVRLILVGNEIKLLPLSISKLINLKTLSLRCNQLKFLTRSLSSLPLVNLDLANNILDNGSLAHLKQITTLESLSLSSNKLVGSLDSELANLPNLKYLFLKDNRIDDITLGTWQRKLKYVDLKRNKFAMFNPNFGTLLRNNVHVIMTMNPVIPMLKCPISDLPAVFDSEEYRVEWINLKSKQSNKDNKFSYYDFLGER